MGLDQYATIKRKLASLDDNFQWRKHAMLQELMQEIWISRGNESEEFNCQEMELFKEDIEKLKAAVAGDYSGYESEGGFFWGHQFQTESMEQYKEQDSSFVAMAEVALEQGDKVYYECWY